MKRVGTAKGPAAFYYIAVIYLEFRRKTVDFAQHRVRLIAADGASGCEPCCRVLDEAQVCVLPNIEIGLEESELHLHPNVGLQ